MDVIKSLICTLGELGRLPRAEWHVRIRLHLLGQKLMRFGREICFWASVLGFTCTQFFRSRRQVRANHRYRRVQANEWPPWAGFAMKSYESHSRGHVVGSSPWK